MSSAQPGIDMNGKGTAERVRDGKGNGIVKLRKERLWNC